MGYCMPPSARIGPKVAFLLAFFCLSLFCSKAAGEICTSTRINSTCDYYVCNVLSQYCSTDNFPEGALIYHSFEDAVAAVAAESRGSLYNSIHFLTGSSYIANVTEMGIENLIIQSIQPSHGSPQELPSIRADGELFKISTNLKLFGVVITSLNPYSDPCLRTDVERYVELELRQTTLMCLIELIGSFRLQVLNGSKFGVDPILSLINATAIFDDMNYRGQFTASSSAGATLNISNCNFFGQIFFRSTTGSTTTVSNSTFYALVRFDFFEDPGFVNAFGNTFHRAIQVDGLYWDVHFENNTFSKFYGQYLMSSITSEPNRGIAHWEPNALFSANCQGTLSLISNRFISGTLYIDFQPANKDQLWGDCPTLDGNPYDSRIRFNQFLTPASAIVPYNLEIDGQFKDDSVVVPAIAVLGPRSPFDPGNKHNMPFITAHHNWWGHPSGPKICCNPTGEGSFTAPFVNPSSWCLDPSCKTIADGPKSLIVNPCILHGCTQKMKKSFDATIIIAAILGLLTTIAALVYATYTTALKFRVDKIQFLDSEEIIIRSSKLFLIGLVASTIGFLSTSTIVATFIGASFEAVLLPLQQTIFPSSLNASFALLAIGGVQVIFNLFMIFMVLMRRRFPSGIKVALRAFWLWLTLMICGSFSILLAWAPTTYHSAQITSTDGPRATGHLVWLIASSNNKLLYLYFVMLNVSALTAMLPGRLIHSHICHPEYVKMTTALEVAMTSQLVKIKNMTLIVVATRIVSGVALAFGVATLFLQVLTIVDPTRIYEGDVTLRTAFTPVDRTRVQFGINLAFTLVGIGALAANIFVLNRIRPAGHYTVVTVLISISLAGTIDVFQKYLTIMISHPVAGSVRNFSWILSNLIIYACWFVLLVALVILLRRIRARILIELVEQARYDINEHADHNWYITNADHDGPVDISHRSETADSMNSLLPRSPDDEEESEHLPLLASPSSSR